MHWLRTIGLALCFFVSQNLAASPEEPFYDLVILNGRLMDPASGLDAVRAVGITGGTILAISEEPLQGRETLDARGMVVAPGFIDLHQHAQDPAAYRVEALDGTTTALELEGGTLDIDRWYDERAGTSIINYGASIGYGDVRMKVMHRPGQGFTDRPRQVARQHARGVAGDCRGD